MLENGDESFQSITDQKGKAQAVSSEVECRRADHLPSQGHEPVSGSTTTVCDAWSVRRQTYTVTFPACAGTKFMLLGDS